MIQTLLASKHEVPLGGFRGIGPLGLEGLNPEDAPRIFATVISNVIGFLTIVAGLWFLFQVIIAGLGWLTAGDDKTKLGEARGKLTSSVIGLGVVALAIVFVRLITLLLGIELVLDPARAIQLLTPK